MDPKTIADILVQCGHDHGGLEVEASRVTTRPSDGYRLIITTDPVIIATVSVEALDTERLNEILSSLNSIQTNSLASWMISCNQKVICRITPTSENPTESELFNTIQLVSAETKKYLPELTKMYSK